jgi:hypothetical protein
MPYQPVSRPQKAQSLAPDRATNNSAGTRTVAGSPEKAKILARTFMRGVNDANDQAPAWGPGSRSFSEQRQLNPNAFQTWGQQLATTDIGTQFTAPPPEPMPLSSTEEVI